MTMRVDVVPFQAMEIAASSPRDLPRFLAGLDDAALEAVRYVAELVQRAADASQLTRKFTAMWVECGRRDPVWPNDTSTLLADTVAAAAEGMAATLPAAPVQGRPPEVPEAAVPQDPPVAPVEVDAETTAMFPPATEHPTATAAPDAASVADSQDFAQ